MSWRSHSCCCSFRIVPLLSCYCLQAFMFLTYFKHLVSFRALAVFVRLWDGQTDPLLLFIVFTLNFQDPFSLGREQRGWKDLSASLLGSALWEVLFDGGFAHVWQLERRAGCVNMQVEQHRHRKHLWMTTVLQYLMEGGLCGTIRREKTCAVSGKGDLILHKYTRGDNWADKWLVLHKEDERTKWSAMSVGGEQCCSVKAASPGALCPLHPQR